jgi:hypothetical protein
MPDLRYKQIQYENDIWKRLLYYIMDENAHLKVRLSEVLKNGIDRKILDKAEQFQNAFLKQDQQILILRNDLAGLDKLLPITSPDHQHLDLIKNKLEQLRINMVNTERQFSKLRLDFNRFLFNIYDNQETSATSKPENEDLGKAS